MPTLTITHAHLEAAKVVPWGTRTCIIAQACLPLLGKIHGCSGSGAKNSEYKVKFEQRQHKLTVAFDRAHNSRGTRDYSKVAAMLPITVDYTIEPLL